MGAHGERGKSDAVMCREIDWDGCPDEHASLVFDRYDPLDHARTALMGFEHCPQHGGPSLRPPRLLGGVSPEELEAVNRRSRSSLH
jgi:hypothetical protein